MKKAPGASKKSDVISCPARETDEVSNNLQSVFILSRFSVYDIRLIYLVL